LGVSGARLFDFTTRQNWGTLTNMDPPTDWIVSSGGYALDFDGSNDYVNANVPVTGYPFAYTVWMRAAALQQAGVLGIGSTTTELEYATIFLLNDGAIRAQISNTTQFARSAVSAANAYAAGVWCHVAAVFTSSTLREIYVDGTLRGTNTESLTMFTTVNAFRIGSLVFFQSGSEQSQYFNGQFDDIRVYNRAPHPDEIRLLARRRAIAYEPEYWVPPIPEQVDSGVAKPVLFHSYYMSQGMRP
jgi:hypothetical protein